MNGSELKEYLTANEASEFLGVSRQRVHQIAKAYGWLERIIKVGKINLYRREDVIAFANTERKGGRPR